MPSSTFFRLPEEKRQRLLDAAWEEFSRTSFAEASINRIIHGAHIPRGSFYQYFADKSGLFWYLLSGLQEYLFNVLQEIIVDVGGDLFSVSLRAFDRFTSPKGNTDLVLKRIVQVMRLNQGMDFQNFFAHPPGVLPDSVQNLVSTQGFRRTDGEFLNHIFFLNTAVLAYAIMETLREPGQWECQRNMLKARVDIVRRGCMAQAEDGTEIHTQQGGNYQ